MLVHPFPLTTTSVRATFSDITKWEKGRCLSYFFFLSHQERRHLFCNIIQIYQSKKSTILCHFCSDKSSACLLSQWSHWPLWASFLVSMTYLSELHVECTVKIHIFFSETQILVILNCFPWWNITQSSLV